MPDSDIRGGQNLQKDVRGACCGCLLVLGPERGVDEKMDDDYDSENEEEFAEVLNVEVYIDLGRLRVNPLVFW